MIAGSGMMIARLDCNVRTGTCDRRLVKPVILRALGALAATMAEATIAVFQVSNAMFGAANADY
ncbi:hypothetical protein [Mariniblastus fucicola]|uniref:Uncharacterized protein n=1 Tax=Mariniblastus fucicola TaxID=980251 RepID=A0A5B9PA45_9BACT|nr:hypothetical protein [Mariniblastus fucicola]QEG22359.1 hypothetical protein MFFC18_22390 [Mariniblastus fucicola]